MTTAVQNRRGTTAEHATFTGLEGEVTIDTTKDTAVIHDGSLAGGYPLAKETLSNVNPSTLSALTGSATASDDLFLVFDSSTLTMKKITRAELNNAIEADALASVDINGGTIDGTAIGANAESTGAFTTLNASTSLNVDGLVTADGLTVNSATAIATIEGSTNARIILKDSGAATDLKNIEIFSVNGRLEFNSPADDGLTSKSRIRLDSNGDISFYEDTGTTPKLTWDASAEALGIGTSSPVTPLHVSGTGSGTTITTAQLSNSSTTASSGVRLNFNVSTNTAIETATLTAVRGSDGSGNLIFGTANSSAINTERMRIDSSGNLGLGVVPSAWDTASSSKAFQFGPNGAGSLYVYSNLTSTLGFNYYRSTVPADKYLVTGRLALKYTQHYTSGHQWFTAPSWDGTGSDAISFTQAMTLDASGRLGIGTSSPSATIHAYHPTTNVVGTFESGDADVYITLVDNTTTSDVAMRIGVTGNDMHFTTSGIERLRIESSGNVGIGTSSPLGRLDVNTASGPFVISNGTTAIGQISYASSGSPNRAMTLKGLDGIRFSDETTERARITSDGDLLVGCTSLPSASVSGWRVASSGYARSSRTTTSVVTHYEFYNPNGRVGYIYTSGSSTGYNTSSDYRLKNITGPITSSGEYIDSLNPVEGTWKADGSAFVGLIAHEVQEASRTTVATGEKDGEEMQGMDYSSAEIIANLIAEIQSLRKRLAAAGIA